MSKSRIVASVSLSVGVVLVIAIAVALYFHHIIMGNHFTNEVITYVYIDTDDNVDSLRNKLTAVAHPKKMEGFDLLASHYEFDKGIRTGRYKITKDMSMLQFMRNVRAHNEVPIMLAVPSVRTINDMAGRLGRQLMIDSASIAKVFTNSEICDSLGYTKQTIPAFFIPNSYEVFWDISLEQLVERLAKENRVFWSETRINKANRLGLNKEEVVTLASIIDSETANNGEKARVAGLYINRLNKGMLLQSDPTVIFAIQDFKIRRVLKKHLAVDSPYNTYKYKGLPPGPIRIPSIAGIDAVLNYEKHPYIYMCAKEDFSGTHNFAKTYGEHLQNARRYINALNKRGIKK